MKSRAGVKLREQMGVEIYSVGGMKLMAVESLEKLELVVF